MNTNTDSAIDLSVRSRSSSESDQDTNHKAENVPIVRPIPRPAWSIIWYQNLWSSFAHTNNTNTTGDCTTTTTTQSSVSKSQETTEPYGRSLSSNNNNENDSLSHCSDHEHQVRLPKKVWRKRSGGGGSDIQSITCCSKISQESHPSNLHHQHDTDICQRSPTTFEKDYGHDRGNGDESEDQEDPTHHSHHRKDCELGLELDTDKLDAEKAAARTMTTVMDVASCDGPVRFERISNPNFALTVEHQNVPSGSSNNNNLISSNSSPPTSCRTTVTSKTYICIYCNQSFKSLFCYQKHKKRHLNPVSVDITGSSNVNTPLLAAPESKSNKTKDLNVQFFPCKKCGSKFPSYYFVHKHKKTCH